MNPIIQTIDVVVEVLIILLLMKLVVDPREFYFNSALRPIDALTDPILLRLRKHFRPTRFGLDYTPLVAIFMLIVVHVLVHWLMAPFFQAVLISFNTLLRFLIMFYSFSIFVLMMVPVYSRNPVTSFLKTLITPFEKPFRKLSGATDKKPSLGVALMTGLSIAILFSILIKSLGDPDPMAYLASWKHWVSSILYVLQTAIRIYRFIIVLLIASVLLTWVNMDLKNPFVNLVFVLTEPILLPVRRLIPPAGGLDLTPWIACIVIGLIGGVTSRIIASIGAWLI